MSTLWQLTQSGTWQSTTIPVDEGWRSRDPDFWLIGFGLGSDRAMALVVPPACPIWVNGRHVPASLRVLEHRDEIHLAGQTYYFSSESLPRRFDFQLEEGKRRPRCPVCRMVIDHGTAVVEYPSCLRVYHQIDSANGRPEKPCFTYRDRCLCGHPTSLSGENSWRPDLENLP